MDSVLLRAWLKTGSLGLCLALGLGQRAAAHTASTAFLQMSFSNQVMIGQLALSFRDLDSRLGLDADDDGKLSWGEVRRRQGDIVTLVQQGLSWGMVTPSTPLTFGALEVDDRQGEGYAVLSFASAVGTGEDFGQLEYRIFFDQDPLHRCLVAIHPRAGISETSVLSPSRTSLPIHFEPQLQSNSLGRFIREGTHHIWTGYDHLLFLLALLLPAVLRRTEQGWAPASDFRSALTDVLNVVTAFTVAHSLTLALAALEIVRLPSRWVESTIAASIIVAACANLIPYGDPVAPIRPRWFVPWKVAFLFGLIHGFGFAGVLGELGLQRTQLAVPLLGFNLGVELGQLACVAIFLPLAFGFRATAFYRRGAVPVGSVLILLLAGGWLIERAFNIGFMPL